MFAIVLTLTLAAPNAAVHARKNHNARVDDTNILPSTGMNWPGNVPASWPTRPSSPTRSGKEKKVEALFAELKNQIGLRRVRLRRLKFVQEQFFLAAAAQNIKRLVRFLSQGP